MKQIKYMIWAMALLLISCNKDNTSSSINQIQIDASIEQVTKANSSGFETQDKIGVFITEYNGETPTALVAKGNYFGDGDNLPYIYDGTNWSCDNAPVWFSKVQKIDVYGYYPYNSSISNITEYPISVLQDQSNKANYEISDFLWIKQTALKQNNKVDLVLKHKLSKLNIDITINSDIVGNASNATVTIKGTKTASTIDLSTGIVASPTGNTSNIQSINNNGNFQAIVIPQIVPATEGFITISLNGIEYKYNAPELPLLSGNQYNYKMNLSNEGITITSNSITAWIEDNTYEDDKDLDLETTKTKPIFSGSFIQQTYAMYTDLGTDESKWNTEITKLKDAGIEYIILSSTFRFYDGGAGFQFYESMFTTTAEELGITGEYRIEQNNSLETCLKVCQANNMKVFVGLNYDSRYWGNKEKVDGSNAELRAQAVVGNKIMDKVLSLYGDKYPNALHGWYWGWEVDNVYIQNKDGHQNEDLLVDMLNTNIDNRNSKNHFRPMMLCPFANPKNSEGMSATEYGAYWKRVFSNVNFKTDDIFAPQDAVGTGYCSLNSNDDNYVGNWLKAYKEAAESKPGLEFWVDVETFDVNQSNFVSSDFTTSTSDDDKCRVQKQLEFASKYSSKIISFSYTHYYSNTESHNNYVSYYNSVK